MKKALLAAGAAAILLALGTGVWFSCCTRWTPAESGRT